MAEPSGYSFKIGFVVFLLFILLTLHRGVFIPLYSWIQERFRPPSPVHSDPSLTITPQPVVPSSILSEFDTITTVPKSISQPPVPPIRGGDVELSPFGGDGQRIGKFQHFT
eukprot:PhF_6_TR34392/c0_g1_i2/m.50265